MQIAKWIIALIAVFNFGGFVADALVPATARQHLWNPLWPPHAKFHDGQTMLMGILGGSLSLPSCLGSGLLRFHFSSSQLPRPQITLSRWSLLRCFLVPSGSIPSSQLRQLVRWGLRLSNLFPML